MEDIIFPLFVQSEQHIAVIEKETDQQNMSLLRLKLCLRKNNYHIFRWVTCSGIMSTGNITKVWKQTE